MNKIWVKRNNMLLLETERIGRCNLFIFDNGEKMLSSMMRKERILIECNECGDKREVTFYGALMTRRYVCFSCRSMGEKNPFYGKEHTEASKKKQSEVKIGMYDGEKNPFYGKEHTEETRKKITEALTGLMVGEKNPFYGKEHTEKTKELIRSRIALYNNSMSDEEKKAYSDKCSLAQKKMMEKDPVGYKEKKARGGTASMIKQMKKYVPNKIEQKVWDELKIRGLIFEFGVILGHKQYDFGNKEHKILIEVQGDYWHGNPLLFGEGLGKRKINEIQIKKIESDKVKKKFAEKHKIKIFYIWESEINEGNFEVLDTIKEVMKNENKVC